MHVDGPSHYEMISFWKAYRTWLAARGYNLWELRNLGFGEVYVPPSHTTSAPLPFARRTPDDVLIERPFPPMASRELLCLAEHSLTRVQSKIVPAQDMLGRDVMLKLVDIDSVEYQINQELFCFTRPLSDEPQGVLPPIAVLTSPYRFAFVVMPR